MAATSTLSPTTLLPDNNNNTSPGITGTEEPEYSLEDYAYYEEFLKVAEIFDTVALINRYYLWPLFALGFPGNCAAIVTIFRMRSCIGTFPVFVVMLAVMDSLAISVKLLYYQLLDHKLDVGATGCNTLRFLGSWTSAYSCWILVFMALERYAAVRFPLKMTLHQGCSAHKVVVVLMVVGVVLALIYLPQMWTSHVTRDKQILQCQYKEEYADFMNKEYFWLSATVYSFVPFCLLTVFNFLIARQIRYSLRVRSAIRNQHLLAFNKGCFDLSIQRQVNLMLLSATMVFVILTFPICLFMLADTYWRVPAGYTRPGAVKYLCQQLSFVLVDSTHAVNFYLYFLSARRFRHHFLRLVSCSTLRSCGLSCLTCLLCLGRLCLCPQRRKDRNSSSLSRRSGGRPTAAVRMRSGQSPGQGQGQGLEAGQRGEGGRGQGVGLCQQQHQHHHQRQQQRQQLQRNSGNNQSEVEDL